MNSSVQVTSPSSTSRIIETSAFLSFPTLGAASIRQMAKVLHLPKGPRNVHITPFNKCCAVSRGRRVCKAFKTQTIGGLVCGSIYKMLITVDQCRGSCLVTLAWHNGCSALISWSVWYLCGSRGLWSSYEEWSAFVFGTHSTCNSERSLGL